MSPFLFIQVDIFTIQHVYSYTFICSYAMLIFFYLLLCPFRNPNIENISVLAWSAFLPAERIWEALDGAVQQQVPVQHRIAIKDNDQYSTCHNHNLINSMRKRLEAKSTSPPPPTKKKEISFCLKIENLTSFT